MKQWYMAAGAIQVNGNGNVGTAMVRRRTRTAAHAWVTIAKRMWSTGGASRTKRRTWVSRVARSWGPAARATPPKRFRLWRGGMQSTWRKTGKTFPLREKGVNILDESAPLLS